MASSNSVIRAAIVVGSGWGRHAAEALTQDPRIRLAGIVGRGSERTRNLAARLDVPCFGDVEEAAKQARPRLAVVSAGAGHQRAIVTALIEAGCDVLCSHPVLHHASGVRELAALAAAHGVCCATDYTLRLTEGFVAATVAARDLGPLLRVAIQAPSRPIVIAIDLALALAGPVAIAQAIGRYPEALASRRARSPAAFAPTIVLEHTAGAVTSIVPVPHADGRAAYRVSASYERGRIDLDLPAGHATLTQSLRLGRATAIQLAEPFDEAPARELYARAMRTLVTKFVDSTLAGTMPHAPLDAEIRVRAVWEALEQSLKTLIPTCVANDG